MTHEDNEKMLDMALTDVDAAYGELGAIAAEINDALAKGATKCDVVLFGLKIAALGTALRSRANVLLESGGSDRVLNQIIVKCVKVTKNGKDT